MSQWFEIFLTVAIVYYLWLQTIHTKNIAKGMTVYLKIMREKQ